MKFGIFSTAPLIIKGETVSAYSPYVKELIVWDRNIEEFIFCCPVWEESQGLLNMEIPFKISRIYQTSDFNFKNVISIWRFVVGVIPTIRSIYIAMKVVDHIHIRCPGNIALLSCIIQVLFPSKTKTAKYAGNWDWNSKQPWSYRFQQRILRNTFLTKNMKVLVYGEWPDKTKNILPFFTASYSEKEIVEVKKIPMSKTINLVFVGSMTENKSPMISLEVCKKLHNKGLPIQLTFCGDGNQRELIEAKVKTDKIENVVNILGNVDSNRVKKVLQEAHLLVFISKSEGWPKAVAEAMFWGCVPITTRVSCVPQMIGGNGERGFLVTENIDEIVKIITDLREDEMTYTKISKAGSVWSQQYTLERFEKELIKLI